MKKFVLRDNQAIYNEWKTITVYHNEKAIWDTSVPSSLDSFKCSLIVEGFISRSDDKDFNNYRFTIETKSETIKEYIPNA